MQNVAGPSLVAMAMKFGLGVEIQSPTGLYQYFFIRLMIFLSTDSITAMKGQ